MKREQAAVLEAFAAEGYIHPRFLPATGEVAGVFRFIFTAGLCVGIDAIGYRTRFCYASEAAALAALLIWDGAGDPPGPWIKEKGRIERYNARRFFGSPVVTETHTT